MIYVVTAVMGLFFRRGGPSPVNSDIGIWIKPDGIMATLLHVEMSA
jgi:hypothetical protein